ncbi:MAG TPA: AraC family transcriptional regulator [Conexibacter sp.]
MDAVTALLDGPRARKAFLPRSSMRPPWSLRIEDEAPLTVVSVVRGSAWIAIDREAGAGPAEGTSLPLSGAQTSSLDAPAPLHLHAGDVAIVRGPRHYTVADDLGTPPQAVILPGQRCMTPDGVELDAMRDRGARTRGNAAERETVLLTGAYQLDGEVSARLLRALPALLALRDDEWDCPLIPLLADEIAKDEIGQEAVLDRLLDLLLVAVLRAWFARPEASAPPWYSAHGDPVVGPALQLLHHEPQRQWTVASLAAETAVSRATLARRFNELVGEPPMAFLTEWRIALASDLLREPGATLGAVAAQVGYGSPFALSAAFMRLRGVSPRAHRAGAGAGTAPDPAEVAAAWQEQLDAFGEHAALRSESGGRASGGASGGGASGGGASGRGASGGESGGGASGSAHKLAGANGALAMTKERR